MFETKAPTARKFNIDPEKWWLEDYFPVGQVTFQGAMLNFAGVIIFTYEKTQVLCHKSWC